MRGPDAVEHQGLSLLIYIIAAGSGIGAGLICIGLACISVRFRTRGPGHIDPGHQVSTKAGVQAGRHDRWLIVLQKHPVGAILGIRLGAGRNGDIRFSILAGAVVQHQTKDETAQKVCKNTWRTYRDCGYSR